MVAWKRMEKYSQKDRLIYVRGNLISHLSFVRLYIFLFVSYGDLLPPDDY